MNDKPLSSGKAAFTQQPLHLLLVEDEQAHAELIQRALQQQTIPIQLVVVRSFREAREYLYTTTPDLVITDIKLPDGNGIELLAQQKAGAPPFPVIVMTSYGDEKMAVEAMKAGALDYVIKSETTFNQMPHVAERALRQWHEITKRQRAEQEIRIYTQQIMALSHLSHKALSGMGVGALMRETIDLITKTLKARYIQIIELLPDHETLLLRAATDKWNSTNHSLAEPIIDNPVLTSGEAVFIEDLRADEQFKGSPLLKQYGLVSAVGLPFSGQEGCLGILWVCSDQPWALTSNDINFLKLTGNTLAAAIEREKAEARMRKLQNDLFQANQFCAVGELGATLVHELNQPITAIINYIRACQQIIMMGKEQATQTIYELMDRTVAEAERATSIIHHLWDFAQTGKLRQAPEDLSITIYDASQLALGEVSSGAIKANFEFDSQLPPAYIDKTQIQQVVFNLVRNAVEALDGSKKKMITIKIGPTHNDTVEVQIQDTGPGVSPALTERVFKQRFSTKNEGMGMGLAISYSIIKAHQGNLWISNTPGGGATFHFTVPTVESNSADKTKVN